MYLDATNTNTKIGETSHVFSLGVKEKHQHFVEKFLPFLLFKF